MGIMGKSMKPLTDGLAGVGAVGLPGRRPRYLGQWLKVVDDKVHRIGQ